MTLIAFSQPDLQRSDEMMAPIMKPGDGFWRSSRVVIDEAIPGRGVWSYIPGPDGVECQAFQWGKLMHRRWYPYVWTIEETDLDCDWRARDRVALVPMRGIWHWPIGMNLVVLNAIRKTRPEPNRINEQRQLVRLSETEDFLMVRAVRGNSYRIVRERKQQPYWKICHCILLITRNGNPLIEPAALQVLTTTK